MPETKVGRVAFGPDERRAVFGCGFARHAHASAAEARDCRFNEFKRSHITGPSSRFAAEFEQSGIDPCEKVCAGCVTVDADAAHKLALMSPSEISIIVNLAIRFGRGTETSKNLAEMLAPYGVRRKA